MCLHHIVKNKKSTKKRRRLKVEKKSPNLNLVESPIDEIQFGWDKLAEDLVDALSRKK